MPRCADRIEAIKTGTIIDWWFNDQIGRFHYVIESNIFLFVIHKIENEKLSETIPYHTINAQNCPTVAKGFIAYLLAAKITTEKELFDFYIDKRKEAYINQESSKPGSSLRDLESEFLSLFLTEEKLNIDFSIEQLSEFIDSNELGLLRKYVNSFLTYTSIKFKIKAPNESGEEKSDIRKMIEDAFSFMLGDCPRKHKQILTQDDYNNLIDWLTHYYTNNLSLPDIKAPIKIVNTNKTFVQLSFRYFYKELYPNSTYPKSLFLLYKSAFFPYRNDKESNFFSTKNNDEVKKLMNIY